MRALVFLVLAMAYFAATPARATEGFTCAIEDKALVFSAGGVFPGEGPGFLNFGAEANILLPDVPEKMRKLDLSQSLIFSWLYVGDLRLRLKKEDYDNGGFKSVELMVQTGGEPDGGDWPGTYILEIFDADKANGPVTTKGKATCSIG
jgi:hypothetical protein